MKTEETERTMRNQGENLEDIWKSMEDNMRNMKDI